MDEHWLDAHTDVEIRIRPEFEHALAERLADEWRGGSGAPLTLVAADPARPRHRARLLLGVAAAVVVAVVGVLVVDARSDSTIRPAISTPPDGTADDTPGDTTVETTVDTTAVSSTPTTIEPSTTSAPTSILEEPADLVIPSTGGPELEPAVLTTLPVGGGPGRLALQSGEFGTPIALLPEHIVVVEDVPFDGLTGRVLLLDRNGAWERDVQVPELQGERISWLEGSPNGLLFVLSSAPDASAATLRAFALTGDGFELRESVELDPVVLSPSLAPSGVVDGATPLMTVPTGASPPGVAVTVDRSRTDDGVARVLVQDGSGAVDPWRLDVAADGSMDDDTGASGRVGDAIWYAGTTSADPAVGGSFVVVLHDDRTATWARLGPWTIAADDDHDLIVTSTSTDGLVIARAVSSPASRTPEDRFEGWPTVPDDVVAIDDVPSLLPTLAIPGTDTPVRGSTEGLSAAAPVYTQIFADPGRDVLLTLQTQTGGAESTPVDMREPTTVAGWDDAFFTPGELRLVASDPGGFVRLTGTGIDRAAGAEIVASMQRRADGAAGWDLPPSAGLVEINGAWNDRAAVRSVTWFAGDRVVAQMLVSPGHTSLIAQALSAAFESVDVDGAQGWWNPDGGRRSVVWSPDGTTLVVLGVVDDSIDPVALARSMVAVDTAQYEAMTTDQLPPGIGDGCDAGLFC